MLRFLLSFCICFLTASLGFGQTISNVSPNSGTQGTMSLPVTISGSGTNFSNATSTVVQFVGNNGSQLQILSVNSVTPTSVSLNVAIPATSYLGGHTVKVYDQSVGNFISLPNGFNVVPNPNPPTLIGTTPEKAAVGQTLPVTISVDNANFTQATDNTIILMQQGTSTVLYPVPGSMVALNNNHIRAWFDFSGSTITNGSVFNSSCWNSIDGSFLDPNAIILTDPTSISGDILYTGSYNGIVELYQQNTAVSPNTYSLVSSATVSSSNSYQFSNVAVASYYIRSVPISMTDVVATYYPSEIAWQNATLLSTGTLLPTTGIDITPVTSLSLPGGVVVNGSVGYGPNGFNLVGDTVAAVGIEVFLMDTDNTLYAQTVTDQNGDYSFAGVPNGNYKIVINLPGYQQISTYNFNISGTSTNLSGLTFLIDDGNIFTTSNLALNELDAESFLVFPNPTDDELKIVLPNKVSNAQITIFNHLGQKVLEMNNFGEVEKSHTLDVSGLALGFYTIRISGDNYSATSKMIKN